MRLYESTVEQFRKDVSENKIADLIRTKFEEYYKRSVGASEYKSWQQSSNFLKNAFENASLEQNRLIIEFELPYSSRRLDVLVFGSNQSGVESVVLIELKQWSNEHVYDCDSEGNVVVDYGTYKKEQAHPSLQVQGYHFDLKDFLTVFSDDPSVALHSCAYCHNYSRDHGSSVLFSSKFKECVDSFPIFAKEDAISLGAFLKDHLSFSTGEEVCHRFVLSPIRPSKRLLEHTHEMINKRQIFNLIDDQIAAYNAIMHKVKNLARSPRKSVVIIKGGPGTGKSVIALEVMGELLRQKKSVFHATGFSAFTNTLRSIVGTRARNLFKFFNSFMTAEADSIDVLVCDEAHRIRETSNNMYTPKSARTNMPQIDELIRLAKLGIFFIDEYQIVRPNEIGSLSLIKEAAKRFEIADGDIAEFELKTQFRCSGSDAYLQWLDKVLEIRESDVTAFDTRMKFKIFDSPQEMMNQIREHNGQKKNSARIVAGFCWPWSEPNPDGSLVNDVRIGNFEMPWEKKNQFWKWAQDDSGMEQVGTVYTAQGFEFDYIGVIFGNDLTFDESTNEWQAVPKNSSDTSVKRNNGQLTQHLKNVYRVLMSRAHKGVYVHFMDKSVENRFKQSLAEFGVNVIPEKS
jgi:DUF2075 family protein